VGLVGALFGELGRFWLFLAEDVVLLFEYFEDMRLPVPQFVLGSLIIQAEPLLFFPLLALSALICVPAHAGTAPVLSALPQEVASLLEQRILIEIVVADF
jgi:hypothetical protein